MHLKAQLPFRLGESVALGRQVTDDGEGANRTYLRGTLTA